MFQNLDVFNMEIGLGVALKLLLWLARVDSFENANTTEVLETELQLTDGVTPCKVLRGFTFLALFHFSTHFNFCFNIDIEKSAN